VPLSNACSACGDLIAAWCFRKLDGSRARMARFAKHDWHTRFSAACDVWQSGRAAFVSVAVAAWFSAKGMALS